MPRNAAQDALMYMTGDSFKFHVPLSESVLSKMRKQAKEDAKFRSKAEEANKAGESNKTEEQEPKESKAGKMQTTKQKKAASTMPYGALDRFTGANGGASGGHKAKSDSHTEKRLPGIYRHPVGGTFTVDKEGKVSPMKDDWFFHPTMERLVYFTDNNFYTSIEAVRNRECPIPFNMKHIASTKGARMLQVPQEYFDSLVD